MHRLYRARGVPAGSALIALMALLVQLAFSENSSQDREWKAPERAASVPNPVAADDRSLAIGKSLYVKECASCHGEAGRGNGPDAADLSRPPSNLTATPVRRQADGEIFWKITEGNKPMPRYARMLKDEQRWNLVNYLRSLAPKLSE